MFRPILNGDIPQVIANQVIELMEQGKLKPGTRLPGERELIKELKISRTSLREGLRGLEAMGFIQIIPGRGTYIQQHSAQTTTLMDNLFRPWATSNGLKKLRDLFEVRLMLETEAAGLAAGQATSEDIKAMRAALEKFSQAVNRRNIKEMAAFDIEFHRTVAEAAGNELLLILHDSIGRSLRDVRELDYALTHGTPSVVDKHVRILDSIVAKDREYARHEMAVHIQATHEMLNKYFEQGPVTVSEGKFMADSHGGGAD